MFANQQFWITEHSRHQSTGYGTEQKQIGHVSRKYIGHLKAGYAESKVTVNTYYCKLNRLYPSLEVQL